MISVDSSNLFSVTPSGYGLRGTLFYNLFSHLQVYRTRAEMIQALPYISDGALSLDGGILSSTGVFSLGNSYTETERQMKDMKWKKEKTLQDIKMEQTLLNFEKLSFLTSWQKVRHMQLRFRPLLIISYLDVEIKAAIRE